MSIETEAEGLKLCGRQSIKFVSAHRIDQNIYVYALDRDDYGQVWVMQFNDADEHRLSECVFTFSLAEQPKIPLCIVNDVSRLHDYMRDRTTRGLAREY